MFRELTKEPEMKPEMTLPWDEQPDPSKVQNEPSIEEETLEDHLIKNIMGIMRLSSYLTIMFTEHGSNIFVEKKLASELTSLLLAMTAIIDFVGTTVSKIAASEEDT